MWLRVTVWMMAAWLGVATAVQAAEPPSPEERAWARLEPGAVFRLGERRIEVVPEGLAAWKRTRLQSALGRRSLADSARPLGERASAAVAALQDGELGWERALLAAAAEEGEVATATAVALDGLFARLAREGAPRGTTPSQMLLHGLLVSEGLLPSLLDAGCMPTRAEEIALLDRWRLLEQAVPSHRFASRRERPEAAELASPSEQPALLAGAIAVAALYGLSQPALPEEAKPGCDLRRVRLVATLASADAKQWTAGSDAFRAIASTWGIPRTWLERMASVGYLRGDAPLLSMLAQVAPDRSPVRALARGAAKQPREMAALVDAGLEGSPALVRWCEAEAERLNGQATKAVAKASQALAYDGGHPGALLTRAMGRVVMGADEEALADLAHMRLLFEDDPVYGVWVDRLARRLDPESAPAGESDEESP